ncbi:hypothetical protein Sru01_46320 [Sphaerisporangium rufum]|uniref:Uncharacterized protein n=1 Tax=Sphaerisporangium rufum TaxID=1381558 RepID=A0A919V6S6_9ACTN|nr:hypothetical protein [Sphaerisporangium rufum]GII79650.1 hypothetical protein Sru01_46320 [Sphaerisporangium rufum]
MAAKAETATSDEPTAHAEATATHAEATAVPDEVTAAHHEATAVPDDVTAAHHEATAVPDEAAVAEFRAYTDALLIRLAVDGTAPGEPPPAGAPPQGWLGPAVEALLLILAGEDALDPLARAGRRDETSTALFLCLALALGGHGDRVHASWLGTAFGELATDRPVTAGQRALWVAAARGAYGPAGKIFVLRRLDAASVSSTADPDRWLSVLVPDEPAPGVGSPALSALPTLAEVPDIHGPIQAATRLSALRRRCAEITATRRSAPASADTTVSGAPTASATAASRAENAGSRLEDTTSGPTNAGPTNVDTSATTEPGPDVPSAPSGGRDSTSSAPAAITGPQDSNAGPQQNGEPQEPAAGLAPAPSTAPAGTPPEDESLRALRAMVRDGAAAAGPMAEETGTLTGHLLDDLRPGADPHLAAIAFHVATPVVRATAEELARATRVAPPEEITVSLLGNDVVLRPEGPDVDSITAAEERIRAGSEARLAPRWLVYGPALLPVVALVLAFTVSELFAVAALVLGGVAGFVLWRRTVREQAEARRVESETARLREEAEAAVWALHDYAREGTRRAETAAEDLAEITRLLRRGPAVAAQRS